MPQTPKQMELPLWATGGTGQPEGSEELPTATTGNEGPGTRTLMEEVVDHLNIGRAAKRVKQNKGSPGVDGMTVKELSRWLREQWPGIREHQNQS